MYFHNIIRGFIASSTLVSTVPLAEFTRKVEMRQYERGVMSEFDLHHDWEYTDSLLKIQGSKTTVTHLCSCRSHINSFKDAYISPS